MIAVIINENAGDATGDEDRVARIRAALESAGVAAEIYQLGASETLQDLADRALSDGATTLVAAGGDGTVGAVAMACHGAGVRLGVLPQGTFNYFARAHGIPEDLSGAAALLADAPERKIKLGSINGRIFMNNASIGLYPGILKTREEVYGRFGRSRIAAYWSVVRSLAKPPRILRLRLTLDGRTRTLRTPLLFAAASAYQLEEFGLEGAEALRKGSFVVLTAPCWTRRGLLTAAWRMARNTARKGEDFDRFTAREIEIGLKRKRILVACDGEKTHMQTPLKIRFDDRPVTLIAPETEAQ